MKRLKVLAVAYACSPLHGSEFGVGWGWVNAIAEKHDVTVITAEFNADEIQQYVSAHKQATRNNPRFVYVKNRPWHYRPHGLWVKIENSLTKPLMNIVYQNWLAYATAKAEEELQSERYDLLHLITYVGWRFPGRFYELPIPFVWGPIGGLKNTPWSLFPALGIRGAIYYGGRNLINSLHIRLLRGPRYALRKAEGAIIAATSEIREALLEYFGSNSKVICEVGIPEVGSVQLRPRETDEPLRICWSGLHLPGKALHLLLFALAQLTEEVNCSLDILGDGPLSTKWRTLARRLRVDGRCQWHGQVSRNQALELMKGSHVLAITSLKELTSSVAIEALSLGLPIICLDHCGMADLVNEHCGIKIAPARMDRIVSGFASAIAQLEKDEPLRWRLAQGGLRRSLDYSWKSKMQSLDEVYVHALDSQRSHGDQRSAYASVVSGVATSSEM